MSDEKKNSKITEIGKDSPPSQLKEDDDDGEEMPIEPTKPPEYTRAIIVQATEDYSRFSIVENFQYNGKEYKSVLGQVELLLQKVLSDIQCSKVSSLVMGKIMNENIEVVSPSGQKMKMKLPQLIASLAADSTLQAIMKQQIKAQQTGKIIIPN